MVARKHYPTAPNGNPVVTPEVSPRACMRFDPFVLNQIELFCQQDQALRDTCSELRARSRRLQAQSREAQGAARAVRALSRRLLNKAPRVA